MMSPKRASVAAFTVSTALFISLCISCGGANHSPLGSTGTSGSSGGSGGGSGSGSGGSGSGGSGSGSGSNAAAQYLYVANNGSSDISGFKINADGTLSPLTGFPVSRVNVTPQKMAAAKDRLLITFAGAPSTLYQVDKATGSLSTLSTVQAGGDVALDPSGNSAYFGGTPADPNAALAAFAIQNGNFVQLPGSPYDFIQGGEPNTPMLVQEDPTGRYVFLRLFITASHTPGGTGELFPRNPDGSLGAPINVAACFASGGIVFVPEQGGKTYIYSTCYDGDSFIQGAAFGGSSLDEASGTLGDVPPVQATTMSSAFGIAVDPTGKWLAITDIDASTVHIFAINPADGSLSEPNPQGYPTGSHPNVVALDASGKFLYTSNGATNYTSFVGSNDISGFSFNPANGALTQLTGSPFATGKGPAALVIVAP